MANFRPYVIKDGDTIHLIAQRELGDVSLALDIATLNDMQYPFICPLSDDIPEGVKTIGDSIYLPIDIDFTDTIEDVGSDTFGLDLLLTTDKFSLSMNNGGEFQTDEYGDLKTISGIHTLLQDLTHRVLTPRGTLPFHPEYGSDVLKLIGTKKSIGWDQRLSVELTKTLLSDIRVKDVKNLVIRSISGVIQVDCYISTDHGEFPFTYSLPTKEVDTNGS